VIGTKISCCGITNNLENRQGAKLTSRFLVLSSNFHKSFLILLQSVLLSLIFPPCINPQQVELPFENIPIGEGIPTNVQHILQDRTGYLWFATWSGLYKYDGYNFTSFRHDDMQTTSIIDDALSVLFEDKAGILWIGSRLGLERFDPKSETFIHYTPNPSDTGIGSNEVWSICEDKFGSLWVGSGNGLYKFDRVKEKFTRLQHDSTDYTSIAHNSVYAIYEDKEGSLWFGTRAGLDKLNFETGKFIHFASKYFVTFICEDNTGILWLGTTEAILEFNRKDGTFSNYRIDPSKPRDRINQIWQDVLTGSLWVGTSNGLFNFNRESKKSIRYYPERIPAVCSERSGTVWIGTRTGIKKLNRIKQPFKKYPMDKIAVVIKSGKEGLLWIKTSLWTYMIFDTRKEKFVPYPFGKDSVLFVFNSGGDLLIYSENGDTYILDSVGNTIYRAPFPKEFIKTPVNHAWKGYRGYWFGTIAGGVHLLDPRKKLLKQLANVKLPIDFIYEDNNGLLWVAASMSRVYCYHQEYDTLIEYLSDTKNPLRLSGTEVTDIYQDKKGRIWFTTNNGLNRFEISTKNLIHFTERDGLPSNNVRGILEDDHGYLWITTNKGISKFNPETNHFKNYDPSYGLELTADFFFGKGCKTSNGEMYFGGAGGFTQFHPDSIKNNPFIPTIVITAFKKFDKPYSFSSEINLPNYENFISFEFAALSYISPERNQYAYMMEGLDKDWVYAGTRRYASYPNLNPGEYVFRVKGSNNDGIWNETGASILIIITPPWWKTIWAYILYAILILSAIYITWKMQVKRIRMSHEYEMSKFEAEKLHEVDELKSRFFANISHEFRTPLTLILGPVKQIIEIIKDEKIKNDLKIVHKNANRLLGLVNQLLDISKLESGNMKLQTVPQNIIPLLKALTLSFTSYAERNKITLKFNSSEDEIIAYIDKDKVEKIITNVLSNAFKFTPGGGKIEVAIKCQAELVSASSLLPEIPKQVRNDKFNYVEVKITDTGVGIPKDKLPNIFDRFYQVDGSHTREQEGTGIGLSLTKELVELHKGKIEVESEEGKGTCFTISIPLGKEHLKPEEIVERDEEKDYDKEKVIVEEVDILKEKKEKIDLGIFEKVSLPLLLIVEDNSDVRNYIKNNLNNDYRILEAVDGEDGWHNALVHIPDLIVSDVMMPKMDGFKLCEKLKTDEKTSHIPVILLTAKAASSDKIEGYETGADDYIMKPFEPEELRARVRNIIEQRERIHEHFKKHGLFEIEEKNITPIDQKFLHKAFDIINKNMSDTTFDLESFAESINLSRSVLHRKITSLTGESPGELIRRVRLKRAAQLIEQKFGNISEISLEVGFSNPSQFTRSFQKQFGVAPSTYQQKFVNNSY
jgi:signal transduction histidine kinase/ligand-binding sensor domain-containing protein/DNA-binding response OmpR family regulator